MMDSVVSIEAGDAFAHRHIAQSRATPNVHDSRALIVAHDKTRSGKS